MKKIMIAATLFVAALNIVSCNPKELLTPLGLDLMIIDGDTVKIRKDNGLGKFGENKSQVDKRIFYGDTTLVYKDAKLPKSPAKKANLTKIKNNIDTDLKGNPFRMIAIGDGVAAGVRDGGYFNEGMATSFPNLIAIQMGIDFKQPYFENADFNGVGRAIRTKKNYTGGPVPKFLEVANNTAYIKKDEKGNIEMKPYAGTRVDNFASIGGLIGYDLEIDNENHAGLNRIKGKEKLNQKDLYLKEKFDFLILCDNVGFAIANLNSVGSFKNFPNGFEGYKNIPPKGIGSYPLEYSSRLNFLLKLNQRKELRGVMFTTPNYMKMPYYNWVKVADVKQMFDFYGKPQLFDKYSVKKIMPNSKVDSLMGTNVNVSIKPFVSQNRKIGIFDSYEYDETLLQISINEVNSENRNVAKSMNFALVDLFTVYEAIFAGKYTTHDGVLVNADLFFSSDGLNPSAFGQAIIANETIKGINSFYGLEIELIATRSFLVNQ